MKRLFKIFVVLLSMALVAPAFANGYGRHGSGHHGGYGHHHGGGWGNNWVGPVLGAAIVGSAIYAASTPSYAVAPPVVAVAPPAPRVAYYCGTSQQFYPNVPTCNVPWQLVSY
ncbi:MAG: hypothetical protein RI902_2510 [Pseudomonadota bacterium]|jgi:hypothetical protein